MAKTRSTFAQRLRDWLGFEDTGEFALSTEIVDVETRSLRYIRLPEAIRDRYKVLRLLGRGAFGLVLLARDLMIGRLISIKLLAHSRAEDEVYQQFLQEARIAGQIEHPNIVTIYDVHEDRHSVCIIMEYLPGGNLDSILRLDGPFDEETALDHMCGILDGLRAAHQMGVIHRDIKPPNILFDQNGRPVISDFGVAHLPLDNGAPLLGAGHDEILRIVGTPEYMAPEQMTFGAPIDSRADLYSAGLLFYEMVTGERLFTFGRSRNIEEIAQAVKKTSLKRLARFPAELSNASREIILKLTERQPKNRYPDARAVLMVLEAAREAVRNRRLTAPAVAANATSYAEMFQDILRLFLVDGVISPPERRELAKRAERLGVAPELARQMEEEVRRELGLPLLDDLIAYEAMVERALSDRQLAESERQSLAAAAVARNISEHEQRKILDRVMFKFHLKEE